LQPPLELALNAAVAVVHEVGEVAVRARPDGHLESIEGEIGPELFETRQPTMARLKASVMNAT